MGTKLGSLTQLAETPASGDKIPLVDISTGITKYVTYSDLIGTTLLLTMFQGCLQRPAFEYNDTTSIKIGAGWYEHNGTAQQMLTWDSQLTYTFGSGGSNANSTDLGASEWHYLYIDDSELSGTTMVAGEFINSTTAPSWSETKHGYYNGNDRCIGMFLTNASSQLIEFVHVGGELLSFTSSNTDRAPANITTSFVEVNLTGPAIAGIEIPIAIATTADADLNIGYYRPYGTGGTGIISFGGNSQTYNTDKNVSGIRAITALSGTAPSIEIKGSSGGANVAIYSHGYYFPRGM